MNWNLCLSPIKKKLLTFNLPTVFDSLDSILYLKYSSIRWELWGRQIILEFTKQNYSACIATSIIYTKMTYSTSHKQGVDHWTIWSQHVVVYDIENPAPCEQSASFCLLHNLRGEKGALPERREAFSCRSLNFWKSQSCFLSWNCFFQCKHLFIDKSMVRSKPTVPDTGLLGLSSMTILLYSCRIFFEYDKMEQAKGKLCGQGKHL